jgi:branched-chain amino acid transport system permease protein
MRSLRLLASSIGAALAGVSGVLAALYFNDVHPAMGTRIMYKLLALVCIGSLGSLQGAIVGAFILALLEGVQFPLLPSILPADAFLLLALAGITVLFPQRKQLWQRGLYPSVSP